MPSLPASRRNKWRNPKLGYAFVHTIIDDHSRVAYTEVHNDESAVTAVGVLHRAVEWFADRGVAIERILSDNGGAYRSHLWRDACEALSITPKRTRPYRPQTNGKVERFHRTMADGWAYARCYTSENERRDALPDWLHEYNQHRPHTACGGQPPFSRVINVPGQYLAATADGESSPPKLRGPWAVPFILCARICRVPGTLARGGVPRSLQKGRHV